VLYSDLMLLLARTTPADKVRKRSEGLSVFLVDLNAAKGRGIEIKKIDAMLNHNTCEVFFDNLEVPAENLVGEEGQGFRYIVDSMNAERILIAAESLGDAKFFIRRAVEYAKERIVFGRPIGQNQGVQFPIARAHAELVAAELVVRKACALFEAERDCGAEANMGKMLAADAAWKAAEACLQTFGGFGYAREYGIERKWRECRLYQTAPISTNMVLAYIGQHVLGLPRSY
jgi:acyl-CoA dehydrogenase